MNEMRDATVFAFKEYAVAYMAMRNPMFEHYDRVYRDKIKHGLLNNLWGNNPGELDRWVDDGGA